ncbi:MAG: protease inhibitor I42 family protein [bacterium]|nr:protease inhibitor I42 family protein [bacterium]
MKKQILIGSLLLITSIFFVSCCCIFSNNKTLKTDNSGETFEGKTGDTFTILLKSNPTTGYSWKVLKFDKKIIELVDSKYTSNSKLIGASGNRQYIFKILAPGKAKLKLVYKREWEKTAPLRTFNINVIGK